MKKFRKLKKGQYPLNWAGAIAGILILTLIPAIVLSILHGNWGTAAFAFTTIVLIVLPFLIQWETKIYVPSVFTVFVILFAYGTEYLGQGDFFYQKFWWWDVMLHSGSGLVFGLIGLILLLIFFGREKVKAEPLMLCFFAFCFALALGLLWEDFEFIGDQVFHTAMQHADTTGVEDTMKDELVDTAGAFLGAALGYLYLRPGGKKSALSKLINKTVERNSHVQ